MGYTERHDVPEAFPKGSLGAVSPFSHPFSEPTVVSIFSSAVPILCTFLPFQAYHQTDIVGKVVTLILLAVSLYLFGVVLNKWLALRGYKSYNIVFLRAYEGHPHPAYLFLDPRGLISGSPIGSVYIEGMNELLRHLHAHGIADSDLRAWKADDVRQVLSPSEIEAVRSACERSLAKQQLVLESKMSRIATAISGAPSLGLLGTVWGVMGAFMAMTSGGSSMISAVAPGISGALLTTVAGLLVAIPATVAYNVLAGVIRRHVVALENFEDSFMTDVVRLHAMPDAPASPIPTPVAAAGQVALVLPAAPASPAAPLAPVSIQNAQ